MLDEREMLLSIESLSIELGSPGSAARVVDAVSFAVPRGRTVALVGESGCGKTLTALSILRLLPSPPARIVGGRIGFEDRDLLTLHPRELRRVRGAKIAMIFQEPTAALNPVIPVGRQVAEAMLLHGRMRRRRAFADAVALLDRVGISEPERRARQYPHQLSGGMCQRVMIAMALACRPQLLIADEPTTALDVTTQAQIVELLRRLQAETSMSMLLITHDLGLVADVADEVCIMYAGRIVERAPVRPLFAAPRHPYTRGLLRCTPRLAARRTRLEVIPGTVPSVHAMPPGCRFHPRCTLMGDEMRCRTERPPLDPVAVRHDAACWKSAEVEALSDLARGPISPEAI